MTDGVGYCSLSRRLSATGDRAGWLKALNTGCVPKTRQETRAGRQRNTRCRWRTLSQLRCVDCVVFPGDAGAPATSAPSRHLPRGAWREHESNNAREGAAMADAAGAAMSVTALSRSNQTPVTPPLDPIAGN